MVAGDREFADGAGKAYDDATVTNEIPQRAVRWRSQADELPVVRAQGDKRAAYDICVLGSRGDDGCEPVEGSHRGQAVVTVVPTWAVAFGETGAAGVSSADGRFVAGLGVIGAAFAGATGVGSAADGTGGARWRV